MSHGTIISKKLFVVGLGLLSFAINANAVEPRNSLREKNKAKVVMNEAQLNSGAISKDFVKITSNEIEVKICMSTSDNLHNRSIVKIKKLRNSNIEISRISPMGNITGDDLKKMEDELSWSTEQNHIDGISLGDLIQESVSAQKQNNKCSVYGIFDTRNNNELDDDKAVIKVFNTCDENDPMKISEAAYKYPSYVDAACE